ncbi:MAG: plasmid mobilization relaxosome protein MobC [Clostridia bacterium]|nr:plasmid mobilization relaxosome protein MobC [Clostridia bacterium]
MDQQKDKNQNIKNAAKLTGIYFKLTQDERKLIGQKMELAGIHNMSAYIRKMCIDGYTVNLKIPELTECSKYLHAASNNLNQIARRVNSGGGYYPDEIDEISGKLKEANRLFGSILEQLVKIQ